MDLTMIGIASAICIAMVIYSLMPNRGSESEKIDQRLESDDAGRKKDDRSAGVEKHSRRQLKDALQAAAVNIAVPTSDEAQSRIKARLISAGIRAETGPVIFLACKTVMGILAAVVTLFTTWRGNQEALNIFGSTAVIGLIAFKAPDFWLSLVTNQRMAAIKKGLADALDMLVIMVEAGLGMDAAIQRVGVELEDVYPELSEEFRIANREMTMGLSRAKALENLAIRTGLKELKSLVATIIQAERFGTSVGKTLRIQSDMLRSKRQLAAEEKAQQTAVKLLIPLILFIFPALMVVVGGPAAIGLMQTFGK